MILRNIPETKFSEVMPLWKGETCVLIGGGYSLTFEQICLVHAGHVKGNVRCITINDAYLWAPWSDVEYFADAKFWRWHTEGIDKPKLNMTAADVKSRFANFSGQKCSIAPSGPAIDDDSVHVLKNKSGARNHGTGISLDPDSIVTGRHSGYQAINIGILAGCKKLILIGYDGRVAPDGRSHFHGSHPIQTPLNAYVEYRKAYSAGENAIKATGCEVVNCSPGSAIAAFRIADLVDELS